MRARTATKREESFRDRHINTPSCGKRKTRNNVVWCTRHKLNKEMTHWSSSVYPNKVVKETFTKKNSYPLPRINVLLDRLGGAKVFTKY